MTRTREPKRFYAPGRPVFLSFLFFFCFRSAFTVKERSSDRSTSSSSSSNNSSSNSSSNNNNNNHLFSRFIRNNNNNNLFSHFIHISSSVRGSPSRVGQLTYVQAHMHTRTQHRRPRLVGIYTILIIIIYVSVSPPLY